ncbi:MAG: hypothetical protein A2096_15715 [Spirochaetes bacterium GWF1_41_5]|nr:MAG: hypothetical protein A2096_15715 [Spirochaetes bacterium GWF1_41_5]HBE04765.1 hypothetical protein [Spirochaetia bacterium]
MVIFILQIPAYYFFAKQEFVRRPRQHSTFVLPFCCKIKNVSAQIVKLNEKRKNLTANIREYSLILFTCIRGFKNFLSKNFKI